MNYLPSLSIAFRLGDDFAWIEIQHRPFAVRFRCGAIRRLLGAARTGGALDTVHSSHLTWSGTSVLSQNSQVTGFTGYPDEWHTHFEHLRRTAPVRLLYSIYRSAGNLICLKRSVCLTTAQRRLANREHSEQRSGVIWFVTNKLSDFVWKGNSQFATKASAWKVY